MDEPREGGRAVPEWWEAVPGVMAESGPDMTLTDLTRDGSRWQLGTPADVAWIADTPLGTTINTAIPDVFDAYATIVLPEDPIDQPPHDAVLLSVLRENANDGRWWLGYLDTGADDVVFPDAPRVNLYSSWSYVLVLAGPEQAATWRRWDSRSYWSGQLPNLMFPVDRCWLVSTLWDDDWTCVGGTTALMDDLLNHPQLSPLVRRVEPGQDATPPGHTAM